MWRKEKKEQCCKSAVGKAKNDTSCGRKDGQRADNGGLIFQSKKFM